ncbi:hypothetical protein QUF72_04280 [Desulfobacterales bacterium HSG2]|nr:hypothetical protein [Desulfobacterales bacterium HSG2]
MKKTALFQIIVFIIILIFIQAAHARKYPMIPFITGIETLYDVWGTSAENVYVVGQSGTILHYDGETLTLMESGTYFELRGIWGSSADDIFAVGGGGTIIRYDGKEWTPMDSGSDAWFNSVWGVSGSDVFAVGDGGVILHYDGKQWTRMNSGTDKDILAVWGNNGTDVFAVGKNGLILHYAGSGWISMNSGTNSRLTGVWGSSGTDVFAVGFLPGIILHYDGREWTRSYNDSAVFLFDLWGSGSDVFASGRNLYSHDISLLHHDGAEWTPEEFDSRVFLNGVWGLPAENRSGYDIFAVGECGTIMHYDGSRQTILRGGMCDDFYQVRGSSASHLFAVGGTALVPGSGVIMHHDGSAWAPAGDFSDFDNFLDIWEYPAENHSEFFVVGASGAILHHDGDAWMQMESGTKQDLGGIWGHPAENRPGPEIFAVGGPGTILHYDGEAWSPMDSGTKLNLCDVWGYHDENRPVTEVFAVGWKGVILHYDGEEWKQMDSGTGNYLNGVWGHPAENRLGFEVFAVGLFGTILHYDGKAWKQADSGMKDHLRGVWGHPEKNRLGTEVFATGDNGVILHYDGEAWTRVESFTKETFSSPAGSLPGSELFVSGGHLQFGGGAVLGYRYFAVGPVLPENVKEGSGTARGEVRVKYAPAEDVPVSLVSDDMSEIAVPDTVVIPAGETSVFFDISIGDDLLRDGSRYVSVTASADGYFSGKVIVRTDDDEIAEIRLRLPPDAKEGNDVLTGEILLCEPGAESGCISLVAEKDVAVSLHSDNTAAVTVPLRVIVPAGQTGIAFDMGITDDRDIDDIQTATVTASVEGWTSGSAVTQVADNDRYVLFLTVPEKVTEGDGTMKAAGTVSLSEPYPSDVTVSILSQVPSELTAPHAVVIPAGQTSAAFDLTVMEDAIPDRDRTVTLRASSADWTSGKADVRVRDTDRKLDMMHISSNFLGIWGNSETNIFTVGRWGAILYYDGMAWTLMESGANTTEWLTDVWGYPTENGSGTGVFAVSQSGGSILHYDGTAWTLADSDVGVIDGIWGSSENNFFAVGRDGSILHYDGGTWTFMESGTGRWLDSVWGHPAENRFGFKVYAVGEAGTILHYDGTAWTQMESGTDRYLMDVWGRPAENGHGYEIFAVGYEGTIVHYDGKTWMPMDSGTDRMLRGMGGTETDVFAVGVEGLILHYDGGAWENMESGTDVRLENVWACPSENSGKGKKTIAFAVGHDGVILRYDGVQWKPMELYENIDFTGIRNMSDQTGSVRDAVAVGNNGAILRYDGTDWHRTAAGTDWQMSLNSVWAPPSSPSGIPSAQEIFAVGETGIILHFDGTDWHKTEIVTDRQLNDIWGTSASDIYVVGNEGTVLYYDGSAWTQEDSGTDADINSVWGIPGEIGVKPEIFAVGNSGTILRRDRSGWIPMNSGTENDLMGVWISGNMEQGMTRAFAVGRNETILCYDGSVWIPMDSGITEHINLTLDFHDVWGNSGTDVFAVGTPYILYYDGIKWTVMDESAFYQGVHGNSGGDVFFAGIDGVICHYSAFTVTIPETAAEGAGILPGTVRIPAPRETDLAVKMTSFDTTEVTVPASVTIPAGQTSVPFELHVSDDDLTDGTQTVAVIATAPGDKYLNGGRTEIRITDNETAVLSLSLPETADEGDETISGVVSMSEPAGKDVAVKLDLRGFQNPAGLMSVTIPAGETAAEFTLSVTDDTEFGGTQPAGVNASVENWTSASASVSVNDNEVPELALAVPQEVSENDGNLSEAGTVSVPGTPVYDLSIALHSDDITEAAVPESVIIPAGEMSASFDITLTDDPDIDGTQTVTVTASADGWTPAEAVVTVNDNDPGILQFTTDRHIALGSDGEFSVPVIRTGSSSGEVTCQLSVAGDQLSEKHTLVFGDGETSFTADLRGFENLVGLMLSEPGGGASLGTPAVAELIIADRMAWHRQEVPVGYNLRDVWGSGYSDVFAVGWRGTILHYDGTEWAEMHHGLAESVLLEGVWGSSGTDVFAVGYDAAILHYNGAGWSAMKNPTDKSLNAVRGSSGSDVFAAGSGVILHYDGAGWEKVYDSGGRDDITALWVSPDADVFGVGYGGVILHYDGTEWRLMESGTDRNLHSVWGSSGTDVFAVGASGIILHYDGTAWREMSSGTESSVLYIEAVWGTSAGDVFAAGDKGIILHYDGAVWKEMSSGTDRSLNSVWGSARLDVFAVGDSGTILHYAPAKGVQK